MISHHPDNAELRLIYADLMLYAEEYRTALQTLEPLRNSAVDDPRLAARRAWILAVQGQSLAEASELVESAVRSQPDEFAHQEVHGRVLIALEKFPEAVTVLGHIPKGQLSLAGRTYLAKVLQMLDRDDEARLQIEEIAMQHEAGPLLPADERLLDSVTTQLLQPAAAVR